MLCFSVTNLLIFQSLNRYNSKTNYGQIIDFYFREGTLLSLTKCRRRLNLPIGDNMFNTIEILTVVLHIVVENIDGPKSQFDDMSLMLL